MAVHSSVLAWRIPGMGEPGGLPYMRSHRVGHDWSDLAATAASSFVFFLNTWNTLPFSPCLLSIDCIEWNDDKALVRVPQPWVVCVWGGGVGARLHGCLILDDCISLALCLSTVLGQDYSHSASNQQTVLKSYGPHEVALFRIFFSFLSFWFLFYFWLTSWFLTDEVFLTVCVI